MENLSQKQNPTPPERDIRTSQTFLELKTLVQTLPANRKEALTALLEELKAEERQEQGQQLLSVTQFANLVGVHQSTVRKWIAQHAIQASKFGRRGRYFIPIFEKERVLKDGLPPTTTKANN